MSPARLKVTADLTAARAASLQQVMLIEELSKRARQRFLDLSRRLNDSLPVSSLPDEVLGCIFEEAVADDLDERICSYDAEDWFDGRRHVDEMNFAILRVCHRWRLVALNTPRLWHDVCAGINTTHPECLPIILEHSRAVPLSLSLDFSSIKDSGDDWWSHFNAALRHCDHAHTLRVRFHTDARTLIDWPTGTTSVQSLVLLRVVTNSDYRSFPPLDLLKNYPDLRTFSGDYINDVGEWWFPSSLTTLTLFEALVSPTTLTRFVDALGSLPSLQQLTILWIDLLDSNSAIEDIPHVTLHELRSFHLITSDEWLFALLLSHVSFPNSLQKFEMHLEASSEDEFFQPSISVASRTVRTIFPAFPGSNLLSISNYGVKVEAGNIYGSERFDQHLPLRVKVTFDSGIPIDPTVEAGHPHARFVADLPLAELRTVRFSGPKVIGACERTGMILDKVETVIMEASCGELTLQCLYDLLRTSPTEGTPFPALRTLVIQKFDLEGLVAEEFCEVLRSRPLPISEMTLAFEDCAAAKQVELDLLARFATVVVVAERRQNACIDRW